MPQKDQTPGQTWNIFARELQTILQRRGLDLGHLDDRAGIHRETVRRLKQSLNTPTSLPVLNPDELELVVEQFQIDHKELLHLRAALLANSTQRMLANRIGQQDAHLAAEQLFRPLLQSLERYSAQSGLGNIRGSDFEGLEDDLFDQELEAALQALDNGDYALHDSKDRSLPYEERVMTAQQAQSHFSSALDTLQRIDRAIQHQPAWKQWDDRAQKGLAAAKRQLNKLGV